MFLASILKQGTLAGWLLQRRRRHRLSLGMSVGPLDPAEQLVMASRGAKAPNAPTASLQLPPMVDEVAAEGPEWRNGSRGRGRFKQNGDTDDLLIGRGPPLGNGVFDKPYRQAVEAAQSRGVNGEAPVGPRQLPTSWTIELDAATACALGFQSDGRSRGHVISMSQAPEKIIQALQIQAVSLTRRDWQMVSPTSRLLLGPEACM